jgi:predicted SAM-dependent methyltransferase
MVEALKSQVRRLPYLERVVRFAIDQRYRLARKHLRGIGIEIGALDRPLTLPAGARAYYLDRMLPRHLRDHYPELNGRPFFVSLVSDGERMDAIRDDSLDFVIANHVMEHCEDPVATLRTFAEKLKSGGTVFMAIPDMRRTFDRTRRETPLEHVMQDHADGPHHSRAEHFREWAEHVEGKSGSEIHSRAQELLEQEYSIHYHCWTRAGFEESLAHVKDLLPLTLIDVKSWRNENIFVLRRLPR